MALAAVTLLCTVGCAAGKDIGVTNASDTTVTVQFGEEDLGEITSDGGVVLLARTECYEGPIVVTDAEGTAIELEGPICPGQTLAIRNETARIIETTTNPY